jgi:hypothetical protein
MGVKGMVVVLGAWVVRGWVMGDEGWMARFMW